VIVRQYWSLEQPKLTNEARERPLRAALPGIRLRT
jgi:hypothetical protein